ncbi:septation protein SepH [Saxibacter everestensis]|uniref:Septation protein SepH n=1 Tax=Saxibacter everestensis TaxID=2909229 RepID=A0ABY8QWI4_9MICO|nr:septation protein SepH [Brevibacteriaceae bacterium ZFBP1038]
MSELKLLGVHDDEEHLTLVDSGGNKFSLAIDESLYAAVRRDRTQLGKLQTQQDPARPRDIQAKIRGGLTAEEVAEQAGVPIEQVRRYEGPVLGERAHIAEQAGRVLVYSVENPNDKPRPLIELVSERLRLRDVDLDSASWDAWRKPDGHWFVELSFSVGTKIRSASWTYNRGSIVAEDDEARWLSDSGPNDSGPIPSRKLAAVSDRVYNVDADGGVRESGSADDESLNETSRILDGLRQRRGRRVAIDLDANDSDPLGDLLDEPAPEEESVPFRSHWRDNIPGAHPAGSAPEEATDAEVFALPAQTGGARKRRTTLDDQPSLLDDEGQDAESNGRAARPKDSGPAARPKDEAAEPEHHDARKSKRPSVPSWEEIMFGAKRD